MSFTNNDLADGITTADTYTPRNLLAGSEPAISTGQGTAGGEFAKYAIVGRITATGKIVAWDPDGEDGEEVAIGIAAQPGFADGDAAVYYNAGHFNHDALVWPAGTNTLALRKAVFGDLGTIKIGSLLG